MSDESETVREPGAEQGGVETAEPVTQAATGAEAPGARAEEATPAGEASGDRADGATPADAEGEDTGRRGGGLEERAAEALHALVERGAEKIPGDQGGTISRFAVALLSFGSAMTERGRDPEEKGASALVSDAVRVFKSLDDDPATQRAAMERALTDLSSNVVGDRERGKVLDVAQQAMGLWRNARGATSGLAASDDAVSLRSLAGMLRSKGDEDGAAQTEEEARKLES